MSYTPVITITGKIQDFLGNNAVGATVSVRLTNFGLDNPRVPGSCIISSPKIPVAQDGLGGFSFTPIGNDVITPPNTFYLVTFTSDNANTASLTIPYQFTGTGSQDLSQIIPFNQGGIGGPQISNIVVKNPTALQTIASFGLSVPQIQDLTAPLLPHAAGGTDIGSASLPFANIYVGGSATNNIKVTGTASAARVFTLPDANSNSVQPVIGATAHQWVAWIDSNGVQHLSQPDYSDLTGKPQLAQTIASASHKWLASYNATTGLFTQTQPDYSDLTSTPQLPIAFGSVAHEFLTSYNSVTGTFTAAQPSFSDISGVAVSGQIPNLDASKITTGTFATAQIPNLDASKITTGQIALARGGTGADLSATGGTHQVLKQSTLGGALTVGQLAYTDISSTPTLPANTTAVSHEFLTAYNSTTGTFTQAQPAYADLTGTPTLPANTPAVSHEFITAYNSTTGAFTQAQPSVTDLSEGNVGTGTVVRSSGAVINSPTIGGATIRSGGLSLQGSSSGFMTLQPSAVASGTITIPAATDTLIAKATTDILTNKTIDTSGTGNHIQIAGVDLPTSIGSSGQVLTNSSGTLAFAPASGGGGASTTLSFGAINIPISNQTYPKAYSISMASSGNNDLYTVPASRLALVVDVLLTNPTGNANSITCLAAAKVSSVYHTFDFISNSLPAGSAGRSQSLAPFLLHAGETFAVNTDHAGGSVWASIIEFDDTANINDSRLFALSTGDNTVFTCPAGKTVQFVGFPSALNLPQSGWVWYWNSSGAIRTISMNAVPSGSSPSAANQIATASSIDDKQMMQQQFYGGLNPGDFINVHTDSAATTQTAWVIYTTA